MALPSPRRHAALAADAGAIRALYAQACARWGEAAVHATPSLLWTLRCDDTLPFDALVSRNWGELRSVARAVCGLPV